MDILDSEASEDEAIREKHNGSIDDRIPSVEANRELIEKASRYRGILEEAASSDETVRQQWDQWEENIAELLWDEVRHCIFYPSSCALPSTSRPNLLLQYPPLPSHLLDVQHRMIHEPMREPFGVFLKHWTMCLALVTNS